MNHMLQYKICCYMAKQVLVWGISCSTGFQLVLHKPSGVGGGLAVLLLKGRRHETEPKLVTSSKDGPRLPPVNLYYQFGTCQNVYFIICSSVFYLAISVAKSLYCPWMTSANTLFPPSTNPPFQPQLQTRVYTYRNNNGIVQNQKTESNYEGKFPWVVSVSPLESPFWRPLCIKSTAVQTKVRQYIQNRELITDQHVQRDS